MSSEAIRYNEIVDNFLFGLPTKYEYTEHDIIKLLNQTLLVLLRKR